MLAIDLYCGLGGWAHGFMAEGYDVVGFDIERHQYGNEKYPAQLVLQDVMTLHGSQFRNAAVIVASPPCQAYSYRAMPWKRAKALPPPDNSLFEACFRIAREAGVPLIVENVKGAEPWVGAARWHYGSYYLWGDVPALMPIARKVFKNGGNGRNLHVFEKTGRPTPNFSTMVLNEGLKTIAHVNKRDGHSHTRHLTNQREHDGVKQPGMSGPIWFDQGAASFSSASLNRKAATAQISKIPFSLAQHIARCFK